MKTNLYVIVATPRKQDIPQVVTTFMLKDKPIFCSGNAMLSRARFFKTYEEAQQFNIDRVQPNIDTKIFASYVRPCEVTLNW